MTVLKSNKRAGLLPEHRAGIAPIVYEVRATIPVVEALRAAGAVIEPLPAPRIGYRVTLGRKMPAGIVAVHVNGDVPSCLRMRNEPEYPGEVE